MSHNKNDGPSLSISVHFWLRGPTLDDRLCLQCQPLECSTTLGISRRRRNVNPSKVTTCISIRWHTHLDSVALLVKKYIEITKMREVRCIRGKKLDLCLLASWFCAHNNSQFTGRILSKGGYHRILNDITFFGLSSSWALDIFQHEEKHEVTKCFSWFSRF